MILGITGGSGCGKTTLLELIQAQGGLVLDCDAIYHRLLETDSALIGALMERFPHAFEAGQLNRKKLGAQVFSDPGALADLNAITHGAVRRTVLAALETKPALAAIDAYALFEGGLAPLCDLTVTVTAPENERIQRLMLRDGITEAYARQRIQAQHNDDWFRARCDYTLENRGTMADFRRKCTQFLHEHVLTE